MPARSIPSATTCFGRSIVSRATKAVAGMIVIRSPEEKDLLRLLAEIDDYLEALKRCGKL
jgi:hypothetical protein